MMFTIEKVNNNLLPCPFCGSKAGIIVNTQNYIIVGCLLKSMICPNPSLVIYKEETDTYNLSNWNKRV